MATSEKAGMVISESLGRKAREFDRTMNNVNDAIKGVSITLMSELLPSLQSAAKFLLDAASAMNSMRGSAGFLVDMTKFLLLSVVPLTAAIFIHSKAIWIANVALRAYGAAIAFFSGPLGWITIGIIALSAAWSLLGKAEREATREQEKFADSVKAMKMDEIQMELRDTERLLTLMRQRYEALREELERDVEVSLFSAGRAKEADDLSKAMARTEARVKILRKAIEEGPKAPSEMIPNAEAMKALEDKLLQLKAAMSEFIDPTAKARAELKAFIEQTVRGKGPITLYQAKINEVTAASERYLAASLDLKIRQAKISGELQNEIAIWDQALADLEIDYERGLVGVENYFAERARIIEEKSKAEIDALKAKRELPGVGEPEKIAIDLEIEVKETGLESALIQEAATAKKAVDEFKAAVRATELQAIVDRNTLDLEILTGQYDTGLVDLATFYRERREMILAEADKEIANIQAEIDVGLPDKERIARENEIARIRARAGLDQIRLNREMAAESRKQVLDAIDLAKMLATAKAEGTTGEIEAMRLRHDAELAELDSRNLEEINQLALHLGQKSELEMDYNEKRQAMEELYAAQDMRRRKKLADQERDVALKRLEAQMFVATELGNIFGQIYEMSGNKLKAFFYLQKAMAIAQIYISAAAGAMKAVEQTGIFGIPMASIIWAMAAANIGIVLAQTVKGFVKGGPVTSGSGRKDDVPAMLTKGEYVQPEPAVRYYGVQVMEAIRRMVIPKDAFKGFGFFPVVRPQFAFAGGGVVDRPAGPSFATNVTVNVADPRLAADLKREIEKTAIRVMKEHS
jgi:hypothetical protein